MAGSNTEFRKRLKAACSEVLYINVESFIKVQRNQLIGQYLKCKVFNRQSNPGGNAGIKKHCFLKQMFSIPTLTQNIPNFKATLYEILLRSPSDKPFLSLPKVLR